MNDHILPHYDEALFSAQKLVFNCGQKLVSALKEAAEAHKTGDKKMTNALIANVDVFQQEAREAQVFCASILSQFHPMASDLRCVVSLMRTSDKLEECSQEIISLARRSRSIINAALNRREEILNELFSMAIEELSLSLQALQQKDSDLAREVRKKDKMLDAVHRNSMEMIITEKAQGEDSSPLNVDLLFLIRSIERIGDIAKSIAAAVIFLTDAQDIRHSSLSQNKKE